MSPKSQFKHVVMMYLLVLCVGKPNWGVVSAQQQKSVLSEQLLTRYLSNDQLAAWMTEFTARCGSISRKYSIGTSINGAKLWVLEISNKPGRHEPEPNFKYVANMHGDETSGRMLLPKLAEWLCDNYQKEPRATRIVNDMHLFLLPTMNPDGFAKSQRYNAAGADLNRDFPDPQYLCKPSVEACDVSVLQSIPSGAQPETAAVMKWTLQGEMRKKRASNNNTPQQQTQPHKIQFTASANMHEGALVVNYPFDGTPMGKRAAAAGAAPDNGKSASVTQEQGGAAAAAGAAALPAGFSNPAPDDKTFQYLASLYAKKHSFMSNSQEFEGGVTNGAAWYDVYGGMQDWNYIAAGCMDLTLELNQDKYPPASELPKIWDENREALIALPIAAALGGVRGKVTAEGNGGGPLPATITVDGISWKSHADDRFGFYSRAIAPGTYTIRAQAAGYLAASATVTVPKDGSGAVLDLQLKKA